MELPGTATPVLPQWEAYCKPVAHLGGPLHFERTWVGLPKFGDLKNKRRYLVLMSDPVLVLFSKVRAIVRKEAP